MAIKSLQTTKRKYIVCFFALALLLGAAGYTPSFLASYGFLTWPLVLILAFTIIGGGSPTLAALITTRLQYGKPGPASLFNQFNPKHTSWVWFVLSLVLPVATAVCVVTLWLAFGNSYDLDVALLKQCVPILLSNLAVNMWEEVGWRGYALPALQRGHSAVVASLIVGLMWALWHWPLFFMANSQLAANYHDNYLLFVGTTLLVSVIYTWLYNSSDNSLLVVSIFHAATNTANFILLTGPAIAYDASWLYFVAVGVIAGAIIAISRPRYLKWRRDRTA